MDHVIVTNFEGDISIYRGEDLNYLLIGVAEPELEEYPGELEAFKADPTREHLEFLLLKHGIDLHYSGPGEN